MELIVEGINIPALPDDELASRLCSLGFPVGPIVDTTRRVYQLKLAKLLRSEDTTASDSEEVEEKASIPNLMPSNHLLSGAVGDSPAVGFHDVPTTSFDRSPSSPFRYDELKRRPLPRTGTNWSSTLRSPLTVDAYHSKAVAPPNKGTSGAVFSVGVKIVVVACVLVFAFLVYHNMESSAANPVPKVSVP